MVGHWANYILGKNSWFHITSFALRRRISYSMPDLFNNLDKSELLILRVLEVAAILWGAWCVFVRHVGLKRFAVKAAWFVIDLLEPELPKRKHNVRSAKKSLHNRRP